MRKRLGDRRDGIRDRGGSARWLSPALKAAITAAALVALLPAAAEGAPSGGLAPALPEGEDVQGPSGGRPAPVRKARLRPNGKAVPPEGAPAAVRRAIRAANRIDRRRYCWGGGHGRWRSRCYDCSGAVSYVLGPHGAGLIRRPMTSGELRRWGRRGKGRWITVYANRRHAFLVIAGLRFDTSQPDDGRSGPGWSKDVRKGFVNVPRKAARRPPGL